MKLKVLLGDDQDGFRKTYARAFLKKADVDQVKTSQELVDMALQNEYAIIITDNSYNDGRDNGGIYAIGEIRKHDKMK